MYTLCSQQNFKALSKAIAIEKTGKSDKAVFWHEQKKRKTGKGFKVRKCFKIHSNEKKKKKSMSFL